MKNRIAILLILSLISVNSVLADYSFVDPSDFTGDAFFTPPVFQEQKEEEETTKQERTMPPVKRARLILKNKLRENQAKKMELAPTAPSEDVYVGGTETSDFASKDLEEHFDEDVMADGFEADEAAIEDSQKNRHFWQRKKKAAKQQEQDDSENIVMDCENMDYDSDTYCVIAQGNVSVNFVKQQTVLKADTITYDRMNNTIKAEGNVHIVKNGQVITGDYIFVDMNEENALIENPLTRTSTIEMRAKKGYVYGDKIVQENGSITVDESFPLNFRSGMAGPRMIDMIMPKNESSLSEDMEKGLIKVKAKELKITQKGDLEVLAIKRATVFKGRRKVVKIPALKVYTNKNNDFAETNSWELGSLRGLGMYIGPGFVFELPHGAVLKAIPMLNYNHGFGVGGIGRYQSATNRTQVAYGSAESNFLIRGKQRLDDNLYLQYGMNDYMNEWFLGRRRPKYGIDLVYQKGYASKDFLLKGKVSSFAHRLDLGYYHDIEEDVNFRSLSGSQIGTLRTRYMMQADQNFYNYKNEDKQTAFSFDISSQFAASLYGTGDTQIIGRIGPRIHTQYKRWMQDIGYFHSVYHDDSPLPVFDAYRYGKSNVYLRETFRFSRYLALSWFGSINLSGDSPNDRAFQENSFYLSVGPEDLKFHIGYDFIRENTYFMFEVMMNAKGTKVDYDKLEIKQDKKAQKKEDPKDPDGNSFEASKKAPVLQHAQVENVKAVEDVL